MVENDWFNPLLTCRFAKASPPPKKIKHPAMDTPSTSLTDPSFVWKTHVLKLLVQ